MCFNSEYLDYACDQIRELATAFPNADGFWFDIIHMNECCCANCIHSMDDSGLDWQNPEHRQTRGLRATGKILRSIERRSAGHAGRPAGVPQFWTSSAGRPVSFPPFQPPRDRVLADGRLGVRPLSTFCGLCAYHRQVLSGMTGKFHTMWGEFGGYKHPNALSYECSLMLAFGAGCSIGDQLHPTGEIDESTYALVGHSYREVAVKEAYCVSAEPVADIALFSASSYLSPGQTDAGSPRLSSRSRGDAGAPGKPFALRCRRPPFRSGEIQAAYPA